MISPSETQPSSSPATKRSWLAWLFRSPDERRFRAGWRLSIQWLLQWVLIALVGFLAVTGWPRLFFAPESQISGSQVLVAQVAEAAAITLSVWFARRVLDHRSFRSLGFGQRSLALRDVGAGLGITFAMMSLIFALEWSAGWLHVQAFAWHSQPATSVWSSVALFFAVCVLVAWNEELMSRGYHLQTIASGMNSNWGWVISSTIFGLLHLANPHATLAAAIGIFLAGLLLGYAYLRTGQLWLSMGLHLGWNYFEGVVFGFPVSGLPFFQLTLISVQGPEMWTGGDFGPEAGLTLLPAVAAGFALISWYARARRSRP